jgi:hypothetical protein
MSAELSLSVERNAEAETRLRMIRELERFLSSTLPMLEGRRLVPRAGVPTTFSPPSARSASRGRSWYDAGSRTVETGPC